MTKGIKQAVWALWGVIVFSALLSLVDILMGEIGETEFMITLILLGATCTIPYKIQKGSNAARYVYLVLTAISVLLLLGLGRGDISLVSYIGSILMLPVDIYIAIKLFGSEAREWFLASEETASTIGN